MRKLICGASNIDKVPDEYIDYILCKKFNYLPSQLDKEDDYILDVFLNIISIENKEIEKENRKIKRKHG